MNASPCKESIDWVRHGGRVGRSESLATFEMVAGPLASRLASALRNIVALRAMWIFIFLVSLYDIWLVYVCRDVILQTEQNPICLALIKFDPVGMSLFTTCKIAGTLLAIAICRRLTDRSPEVGSGVTSGLAGFQGGLLMYLSL